MSNTGHRSAVTLEIKGEVARFDCGQRLSGFTCLFIRLSHYPLKKAGTDCAICLVSAFRILICFTCEARKDLGTNRENHVRYNYIKYVLRTQCNLFLYPVFYSSKGVMCSVIRCVIKCLSVCIGQPIMQKNLSY